MGLLTLNKYNIGSINKPENKSSFVGLSPKLDTVNKHNIKRFDWGGNEFESNADTTASRLQNYTVLANNSPLTGLGMTGSSTPVNADTGFGFSNNQGLDMSYSRLQNANVLSQSPKLSTLNNGTQSAPTLDSFKGVQPEQESRSFGDWFGENGGAALSYAGAAMKDFQGIKEKGLNGWASEENGSDMILNKLDPLTYAADGRSNKTGRVLSKTGNSVFMAGAQTGNPYVMLAGAALKVGGGITNLIGGFKTDEAAQQRLGDLEQRADDFRSQAAVVGSNEDLANLNVDFTGASLDRSKYKGGLTSRSNRKAEEQYNKDRLREATALNQLSASYNNALTNVEANQQRLLFANYSANGGYIKDKSYNITPEQYKELIKQGYKLEIL